MTLMPSVPQSDCTFTSYSTEEFNPDKVYGEVTPGTVTHVIGVEVPSVTVALIIQLL